MNFVYSTDPSQGISDLGAKITELLNTNKKVLWLLAGGSNIPIAVDVMKRVRANISSDKLSYLTLALSDERYGQVGHADSNWQQLTETDFDFSGIKALSIIHGESLEKTISDYAAAIEPVLKSTDYIISQFGLGSDGHIAGILPRSPATHASGLVTGYVAQPFTRISLTFDVLRQIDVAYGFVFGAAKGEALHTLDDEILSVVEQPAQILREIPEVYIYQDVIS